MRLRHYYTPSAKYFRPVRKIDTTFTVLPTKKALLCVFARRRVPGPSYSITDQNYTKLMLDMTTSLPL